MLLPVFALRNVIGLRAAVAAKREVLMRSLFQCAPRVYSGPIGVLGGACATQPGRACTTRGQAACGLPFHLRPKGPRGYFSRKALMRSSYCALSRE